MHDVIRLGESLIAGTMALERPGIKHKLSALTTTLRHGLDKKITLKKHLNEVDNDPTFTSEAAFEFPSRDPLEWFNSAPLSFVKDLKGKVVVLDFFTYCCINCMHVLPDLAALEELYPVEAGLVVVGVHSAKFLNEKTGDNIKNAILRYNIAHPVVNDPDTKLWDHLGITCWPTLVVFGPSGQLVYSIIGEGHRDEMMMVVSDAMQHYKETGALSVAPLPITLLRDQLPLSKLKFPGKVCVDASNKLFVSDSGHHRILEVELPGGRVSKVIGSGQPGWKDGSPTNACFKSPQGLVVHNGALYVADTENHILRKVRGLPGWNLTVPTYMAHLLCWRSRFTPEQIVILSSCLPPPTPSHPSHPFPSFLHPIPLPLPPSLLLPPTSPPFLLYCVLVYRWIFQTTL